MVKNISNSLFLAPLVLSLSAVISTLAQYSSSDTACTQHYVVQDGDTCDKIGQKTFTSTAQIMSLNLPYAGPNCYQLETGRQLCLGTYGNDCQLVYRAKNSDNCESITSQFNINTATLLTNNAMLKCGQVYGGLMLCVVDGIIRPPAPIALNVSYNPLSPGYTNANSTMPLGTAIMAVNAGTLPAAPVQSSSASIVAAGAATGSTGATSSTASTATGTAAAAAGASGTDASGTSKTKPCTTTSGHKAAAEKETHSASHHWHHEGHKPHGHSHHAAAKKWHDSH